MTALILKMLHPYVTRGGTFLAGVVGSAMALTPEQYATVENGIIAFLLIALDQVTRRIKV